MHPKGTTDLIASTRARQKVKTAKDNKMLRTTRDDMPELEAKAEMDKGAKGKGKGAAKGTEKSE